jgi:peptide/nickel transport system permease protein
VLAILFAALLAPFLAHADPLAQNLAQQGVPPGFIAVGIAIVVGTAIGTLAGYARGTTDSILMGAMDVMLAFPSIILAIAITTILGPSIRNLMIAIGIVYIPQYARLARSSVLSVAQLEYVEAARAIGSHTGAILVRHILPNILAPLLVQATLGIATAELEAAGLSYLGLGARPPAPEWGAMLSDARDYWLSAPWALIFPGLSITALVLGFNLLGDGLRDALDPTGR